VAPVAQDEFDDAAEPICSVYKLSNNDLPAGVICDGLLNVEYHAGTEGDTISILPGENMLLTGDEVQWFALKRESLEQNKICSKVFLTTAYSTASCRCISEVVYAENQLAAAILRRLCLAINGADSLKAINPEFGTNAMKNWSDDQLRDTMDRHADFLTGLFESYYVPPKELQGAIWKFRPKSGQAVLAGGMFESTCPSGIGFLLDASEQLMLFHNGVIKIPDVEHYRSPVKKRGKKETSTDTIVTTKLMPYPIRKNHAQGLKERIFNNQLMLTLLRLRSKLTRDVYNAACDTKTRSRKKFWNPHPGSTPLPKSDIWKEEYKLFYGYKMASSTWNEKSQSLRDGLRSIPANRILFASPDDCIHGTGSHGRIRVLRGTQAFMVGSEWCSHPHDMFAFGLDGGVTPETSAYATHTSQFLENIRNGFIADHGCNARENNSDGGGWSPVLGCPEIWVENSGPDVLNGIYEFVPDGSYENANTVFRRDMLCNWVKAGLLTSHHARVTVQASVVKLQCKFTGRLSNDGHCGNIERKLGVQVPRLEFGMRYLKQLTETKHDCAFICIIPLDPEGCVINFHTKQPRHSSAGDSIFGFIPYLCYIMFPATVFHSHGMNNALAGNTILQLQVFFTANNSAGHPVSNPSFHYKEAESEQSGDSHGIISLRPNESDIERLGEANVQLFNQRFVGDHVLDVLTKLLLF
jgi:hypothetical protein